MPAPLSGGLVNAAYRIVLGGFEITTIFDGGLVRQGLSPPFALGVDAATLASVAEANRLPTGWHLNGYTVALVNTGSALVLFDTGNGAHRTADGVGFLRERLALAGYKPGDVDIVAFTHGHPDHIGGVMFEGGPTFPNARYVIGRTEYEAWISGDRIPERRKDSRALFQRLMPPLAGRMTFIEPGEDVVAGITALEAFGHSPGHLAYRVASGAKSALIWGDVANHYAFSFQHPEWPMAMDDDRDLAIATRRRFLDMAAAEGITIVGFHMPFPGVGFVERRTGGGYRWVPASYQHLG